MDQFAKEGKGGNVLSPLIKTPAASREHILSYILYSTYSKSFFFLGWLYAACGGTVRLLSFLCTSCAHAQSEGIIEEVPKKSVRTQG